MPDIVKIRVRFELMKCARAGEITYYDELKAAVGMDVDWTPVLDRISTEEILKGEPDITDIILNATTGWPGRISRKYTYVKPTPEQKEKAQRGLDAVFKRYCPGKQAPTLPLPRRKRRR
jgi:hypothetical protein